MLPGLGSQVRYVSIDVVEQESASLLKTYSDTNGFNWPFAVGSTEMDQALVNRFGIGFLTTTSVPMFVIDRKGQVHLTQPGHKSAEDLRNLVAVATDS